MHAVWRDYMELCRLHRPIGIWLLLFPGFVGLSSAQLPVPTYYWVVFIIGAVVMRSAGCVYNDIIDRRFDSHVARTQNRPLARKDKPLSLKMAFLFLVVNLAVGLACLLYFSFRTWVVGFSVALMIASYPWMKRITYWPQAFLGLTMNAGCIIGWFAVDGDVDLPKAILYFGMVFWTLGYDTIYGFQDVEDDVMVGVKSASLKVQACPRLFVFLVYSAALIAWLWAGLLIGAKVPYYVAMVSIGAILAWQVVTLQAKNSENCLERFKVNQWVGVALWLGVLFGI